VSLLSGAVAAYIAIQRNRFARVAQPLPPDLRISLQPYFSAALLDDTRLLVTPTLPWPLPTDILGLTLDHLILIRDGFLSPLLLFHELIHVAQYRHLGISTFARLYTHGFFATRSYQRIPLERCAYELEYRFVTDPEPFDAEAAAADCLEEPGTG
jgi:hypothetical protein